MAASGARASWAASCPAKGRQASAPTATPKVVTWSADACRSAGFWLTTATAYDTAASRHSSTPPTGACPPPETDRPTRITPANDTATPASSVRGRASLSSQPLSSAMITGPTLTTMAAVPASTFCSPQFSATM